MWSHWISTRTRRRSSAPRRESRCCRAMSGAVSLESPPGRPTVAPDVHTPNRIGVLHSADFLTVRTVDDRAMAAARAETGVPLHPQPRATSTQSPFMIVPQIPAKRCPIESASPFPTQLRAKTGPSRGPWRATTALSFGSLPSWRGTGSVAERLGMYLGFRPEVLWLPLRGCNRRRPQCSER